MQKKKLTSSRTQKKPVFLFFEILIKVFEKTSNKFKLKFRCFFPENRETSRTLGFVRERLTGDIKRKIYQILKQSEQLK